jgi:hypothetical protein
MDTETETHLLIAGKETKTYLLTWTSKTCSSRATTSLAHLAHLQGSREDVMPAQGGRGKRYPLYPLNEAVINHRKPGGVLRTTYDAHGVEGATPALIGHTRPRDRWTPWGQRRDPRLEARVGENPPREGGSSTSRLGQATSIWRPRRR